MKTIQLAIDGMHCGHCVGAVKQALTKVPGVASADVHIGGATVQAESDTSQENLRAAVEEAGYFAEVRGG